MEFYCTKEIINKFNKYLTIEKTWKVLEENYKPFGFISNGIVTKSIGFIVFGKYDVVEKFTNDFEEKVMILESSKVIIE